MIDIDIRFVYIRNFSHEYQYRAGSVEVAFFNFTMMRFWMNYVKKIRFECYKQRPFASSNSSSNLPSLEGSRLKCTSFLFQLVP